jgi:hypothetical protein
LREALPAGLDLPEPAARLPAGTALLLRAGTAPRRAADFFFVAILLRDFFWPLA